MVCTDSGDDAFRTEKTTTPAALYGLSHQEALAFSRNTSGCAGRFKLLLSPPPLRQLESPKHTASG
eukprot:11424410-Karenia_brevis.AAC.1